MSSSCPGFEIRDFPSPRMTASNAIELILLGALVLRHQMNLPFTLSCLFETAPPCEGQESDLTTRGYILCHCSLGHFIGIITNDQRLTEYSRLYISNTFLSIFAVSNKVVFCITLTSHVIPSFPIHLSNSVETLPRAPITTGTIFTFLNFHNLLISLFKSWYFSTSSIFILQLLQQLVQQYR